MFDGEQTRELKFVRPAQELGFSLSEVKELLALRQTHHACSDVQSMLKGKLADVQEKIKSLARLEAELAGALRNCNRELRLKREIRHENCCRPAHEARPNERFYKPQICLKWKSLGQTVNPVHGAPWLLAWLRSAASLRPQAAARHCCRLSSLPAQQAHRPLSPNCDPTCLCCRCCSLPLAFISPGEPDSAIASPAGSAHFFCGSRRLWCFYSSSSHR